MAKRLMFSAILAAVASAAPGQTTRPARPAVALDRPVRLAFAGVTIAMPKGFDFQTSSNSTMVIRAVKTEKDKPVMAVTLSAWPAAPKTTLATFIRAVQPKTLALKKFKIVKTIPLKVAGLPAEAWMVSYTYEGVDTTAMRVYFLRDLKRSELKIGYALIVEANPKRGAETLAVLRAVLKTFELSPLVRPKDERIVLAPEPIVSRKHLYSIRPPMWWKIGVTQDRSTIHLTQMDYVVGNTRMPYVGLFVQSETASAKDSVTRAKDKFVRILKSKGVPCESLLEGPARMGGLDGYEFYVRHKVAGQDGKKIQAVFAQRTVCANGRSYMLLALCETDQADPAAAVINALASGFKLLGAATAPAAAPATGPATAPTTRPAKVPERL